MQVETFDFNMENKLHEINRAYVAISAKDDEISNNILHSVLPKFIDTMKQTDPLFNAMYRRVFYGGSYYDGLKVGKPEEFDLDLLLDIPRYAEPELVPSKYPGFVRLKVNKLDAWMRQPEAMPSYRSFERLLDGDGSLNTQKTLAWTESLVQRSLNNLPRIDDITHICYSNSGPALTLHIHDKGGYKLDVDFVPCFVFGGDKWPRGFRENPVPSKPEFFVVPKKPKEWDSLCYWRLSFQEQERAIIADKNMLKPTLRLLKVIRDNHKDNWIASYYIKTVLLHLCEKQNEQFWSSSLLDVFKTGLDEYKKCIESGTIPYYWDGKNNLIRDASNHSTKNVANRINKLIKELNKKNPDEKRVEAYFLNIAKIKRRKKRYVPRYDDPWLGYEDPLLGYPYRQPKPYDNSFSFRKFIKIIKFISASSFTIIIHFYSKDKDFIVSMSFFSFILFGTTILLELFCAACCTLQKSYVTKSQLFAIYILMSLTAYCMKPPYGIILLFIPLINPVFISRLIFIIPTAFAMYYFYHIPDGYYLLSMSACMFAIKYLSWILNEILSFENFIAASFMLYSALWQNGISFQDSGIILGNCAIAAITTKGVTYCLSCLTVEHCVVAGVILSCIIEVEDAKMVLLNVINLCKNVVSNVFSNIIK